eukprot:446764-Hanusia_phi.AAC.2
MSKQVSFDGFLKRVQTFSQDYNIALYFMRPAKEEEEEKGLGELIDVETSAEDLRAVLTRQSLEGLLVALSGKVSDQQVPPPVHRSLPEEPRLPPELSAIPEPKTTHLQALKRQLSKAVPAGGQRDRVHQFLSSLLDYVSYMCEALDQSENSRIACELDRKIATKIRGDIIPTIRNFCNDIKSVNCEQSSDEVITKAVASVDAAESKLAQAKDVSSKKKLIHEVSPLLYPIPPPSLFTSFFSSSLSSLLSLTDKRSSLLSPLSSLLSDPLPPSALVVNLHLQDVGDIVRGVEEPPKRPRRGRTGASQGVSLCRIEGEGPAGPQARGGGD